MILFKGNDSLSHTYLIERFDSCMLIDPSHDYELILKSIGEKTLKGILITHAHHDHIDLIGFFDVPIYIHKDDAHLLFEDRYNGYYPNKHPYKRKNLKLNLISDEETIPLADLEIKVIHTPGHTKGSVSYLFEKKLFTGDTLFKGSVGRHDLYSGNLSDLKKSIRKLMSLDGQMTVYPGHDQKTTIRNEKKLNPFVIKWEKQKNGR